VPGASGKRVIALASHVASLALHAGRAGPLADAGGSRAGPFVHCRMRFPHFLFTFASLTLALAPVACSSSSSNCTYTPGPPPVVTLQAPCGLTITAFTVTGPCQKLGNGAPPQIEDNSGAGGTCDVTVTLSNGAQATGSVTFTLPSCGSVVADTPVLDFDAGACDAGTATDATAG
jgi:hypothetical protein